MNGYTLDFRLGAVLGTPFESYQIWTNESGEWDPVVPSRIYDSHEDGTAALARLTNAAERTDE